MSNHKNYHVVKAALPVAVFNSMDLTTQNHLAFGWNGVRQAPVRAWAGLVSKHNADQIKSLLGPVLINRLFTLLGVNRLEDNKLLAACIVACSGRPVKVRRDGLIARTTEGATGAWRQFMDEIEAKSAGRWSAPVIGFRAGAGNPAAKRDVSVITQNAKAEAEAASAMQEVGNDFDTFLGVKQPISSESAFQTDDDELLETMIGATPIIDDFDNEEEQEPTEAEAEAEPEQTAPTVPAVTRKPRSRAKRKAG